MRLSCVFWTAKILLAVSQIREILPGPHSQQHGTTIQRNWPSYLYKYQCFESRNLEAEEDQISIYAAVTGWCYQFGLTNEEKEQVAFPVDTGVLTMVEPEEVEMLVSLPNLAL